MLIEVTKEEFEIIRFFRALKESRFYGEAVFPLCDGNIPQISLRQTIKPGQQLSTLVGKTEGGNHVNNSESDRKHEVVHATE